MAAPATIPRRGRRRGPPTPIRPASSIGAQVSAAEQAAATTSLVITTVRRLIGLASRKTAVPSSISAADRPGPEEERDERHERADPQAAEQAGGEGQGARLLAGEAEDAGHQHQHAGQQEQQQRPPSREELAQGDRGDDAVHRRTR